MGRDYRVRAGQPLIKHLQQLQDKLAAVERDMSLLKSRLRSPTHPIYDPSFPLDAVDGQFALQGGVPHYYWGGAWHTFAGGGGASLPYCDAGQFRSFNPGGATQFRWTNIAGNLERNDPMFDYADANTAISINSEGVFSIMATAGINFGNTALTSDRIIDWEYDTGGGYTPFGTFQAQGPLVTGRPALAAIPAASFAEYQNMVAFNYWVGTLASTGLGALPLKIRPVLDVNMGASNPLALFLSMFVTRIGDPAVFV